MKKLKQLTDWLTECHTTLLRLKATVWPDWAIFKALGDKISSKRSPTDWQLLGCFEKPHSFVKATLSTLWSTFGKFGLLFDSNVWSQWKQKIKVCYRNWMFSRHTREHLLKGLTNNFCCCFNWQYSNLYLKRADFWKKTFLFELSVHLISLLSCPFCHGWNRRLAFSAITTDRPSLFTAKVLIVQWENAIGNARNSDNCALEHCMGMTIHRRHLTKVVS